MKKMFFTGNFKIKCCTIFFLFTIPYSSFTLHAQTWSALGTGLSRFCSSLTEYNGNLIAGGYFNKVGENIDTVAQWNGTSWGSLAHGMDSSVYCLIVYNSSLYALGSIDSIGGAGAVNNVAQWNGTSWSPVGNGTNGPVNTACIYNGNLILGGSFNQKILGIPSNYIVAWNGSAYSTLGVGLNGPVKSLCVYNGNLIAGGNFSSAGGKPAYGIAQWNGISWDPIVDGITGGINPTVEALITYNGDLIVGGNFTTAGRKPASNIAEWNGSSWSQVGSGLNNKCTCLTVYNGMVVAGVNSPNYIGVWNGSSWGTLGSGLNGQAYCLTVFNGNLIAGGQFTMAGGNPANNIAVWSANSGINNLPDNNDVVSIYPNPSKGVFTLKLNSEILRTGNNIEIYNMLGEKVYSKILDYLMPESAIDISNQPSGIYFYRIITSTVDLVSSGKIIIQ